MFAARVSQAAIKTTTKKHIITQKQGSGGFRESTRRREKNLSSNFQVEMTTSWVLFYMLHWADVSFFLKSGKSFWRELARREREKEQQFSFYCQIYIFLTSSSSLSRERFSQRVLHLSLSSHQTHEVSRYREQIKISGEEEFSDGVGGESKEKPNKDGWNENLMREWREQNGQNGERDESEIECINWAKGRRTREAILCVGPLETWKLLSSDHFQLIRFFPFSSLHIGPRSNETIFSEKILKFLFYFFAIPFNVVSPSQQSPEQRHEMKSLCVFTSIISAATFLPPSKFGWLLLVV